MNASLTHKSLILIGMPGAGKSTIGVLLAKFTAKDFVDTDILIQLKHAKTLDAILREQGYLALRTLEEAVLLDTQLTHHIIATGGSAVYSDAAMVHLKQFGPLIYLKVSEAELLTRITNMDTRGIAAPPEHRFSDIFAERAALYERYADVTIDCDNKSQDAIVDEILLWLDDGFVTQDA